MWTIRKEQVAVFAEASRRDFEARALAYLATCYPEECQGRGEYAVRKLIRKAMDRTVHYQLTSETGVLVYLELCMAYGDDFYRQPWALYILHHGELDEQAKVERLRGYLGEGGCEVSGSADDQA
jgi:hypothetical protein